MIKKILFFILGLSFLTGLFLYFKNKNLKVNPANQTLPLPRKLTKETDKNAPVQKTAPFEIVAENLKIPWEIVFLPDGRILVTERPGSVKILEKRRVGKSYKIKEVLHYGEGGLLGAAIHPEFEKNKYVYLYFTYKKNGEILNKVNRYRLEKDKLVFDKTVIDGIKGAIFHDGGRIEFGPDGYLYITTGDATQPELSQDPNNLNGKILRIKDDGSIPEDNPFNNPVYSYGHRNPQGLAWDENGQLWITEHGPSGLQSGYDEINKIVKGGNYGWPEILGGKEKPGMIKPVVHSGPDETWAPAGAVFYKGYMFFAGLRGESLYRFDPKTKKVKAFFKGEFGRLRAVVLGPDNYLYISTSNTDGRGRPRKGDDKIIKINPEALVLD